MQPSCMHLDIIYLNANATFGTDSGVHGKFLVFNK